MAKKEETINIDGIDYKLSELSQECKDELVSLQFCETELVSLAAKMAVTSTAKVAYQNAVKALLENDKTKH
jgi:hypothetical protein|tara:strand:- start:203 stop:415 length:213 start_codon:yes stop_codon:yes gene_type:complete